MDRTVLVADADVNAQVIAKTLLQLRGLDIRVTDDGISACEIVRSDHICTLVLDLNLPRLNGFEVLRRLRGQPGCLATTPRILVVTDRQEPELERFVRRFGADAFMRKPMNPRRFIAAVEQLVGSTAPQAA